MMRSKFDMQLDKLNDEMSLMADLCIIAIKKASVTLQAGTETMGQDVLNLLSEINEKEREIERICIKLLLRQQPVAKDLRVVSAAIKMVTDFERIGDQSADIVEIVSMGHTEQVSSFPGIRDISEAVIHMVTECIEAFLKKDEKKARNVISYDDVVDALFDKIKLSLIEEIHQDKNSGEKMLDILMITKYFERIGDHAVNVAKWVVYSVTGEMPTR